MRLVGGDTSEADDLIIDCMMVGFAKEIVRRTGARPGEYVVTSGTFGQTTAGLRILIDGAKAEPRFRKEAVSSVLLPRPRLELGLALSRYLSSSIDSSDGLAISLHTISEMSGVGIRLSELPYAKGLAGVRVAQLVLGRGAGALRRGGVRDRRDGVEGAHPRRRRGRPAPQGASCA